MNRPSGSGGCGITRRGFLLGAGTGLAAGASAAWLGLPMRERVAKWQSESARAGVPTLTSGGMPGPYPGRVVEVYHPGSVSDQCAVHPEAVPAMVQRGMGELTGTEHPADAWRRLFQAGDVVGIKVNPVGRRHRPNQAAAISSPALVLEVVAGLRSAGVRARDIVLFERYADQFRAAGYEELLRERSMDGVRWYASSASYDDQQLDIEGYDRTRDRDPHVVGYDPDVFVWMGYASPRHDPKDDRRLRSHLAVIVSRMVDKVINLPVLKDHGSAGVTLALKNLSHGLNNNVARSHISGIVRLDGGVSGPNQCNTFIPTAAGQQLIRRKVVLHILDGLVGVYQGGPSSGRTWPYRSLLFATDPVALDHVGWDIVDARRVREGRPPVGQMGLHGQSAGGRETEHFDRRQPEHIYLAGTMGLGIFDARGIEHQRIEMGT